MIEYWTLAILFLITITSYLFFNSKSKYWKKRNVPYVPPLPLVGNFKSLVFFNKSIAEIFGDLYNADEGSGCRFFGIHTFGNKPGLVVKDPELIKMIFVKDFKHFSDRISDCDEKRDPLGFNNLFVLKGQFYKLICN